MEFEVRLWQGDGDPTGSERSEVLGSSVEDSLGVWRRGGCRGAGVGCSVKPPQITSLDQGSAPEQRAATRLKLPGDDPKAGWGQRVGLSAWAGNSWVPWASGTLAPITMGRDSGDNLNCGSAEQAQHRGREAQRAPGGP